MCCRCHLMSRSCGVLGWDESSWEELRWHLRRKEMRWEELKRSEITWEEMRWDELRWSVKWTVSNAENEECSVRGEVRSLEHKTLLCIALHRGRAPLGQQHRYSFAQSTHTRAALAHGACKFWRWKRSDTKTLRQLPPHLVRVLLVVLLERYSIQCCSWFLYGMSL